MENATFTPVEFVAYTSHLTHLELAILVRLLAQLQLRNGIPGSLMIRFSGIDPLDPVQEAALESVVTDFFVSRDTHFWFRGFGA